MRAFLIALAAITAFAQTAPRHGVRPTRMVIRGAMVVEGIDDGDGDFIESVRQVVGPNCPIVATFDLHGNHTQRRLDAATAVIGFDTYPHVDMSERGQEAADLIGRQQRCWGLPIDGAALRAALQRDGVNGYWRERIAQIQGGALGANLGDTSGALQSYQKALAIRQSLAARQPADPADDAGLAIAEFELGALFRATGQLDQAEQCLLGAATRLDALASAGTT